MSPIKHIFATLLLSAIIVPPIYGQPAEPDGETKLQPNAEHSYAMLIRNMNHLNAALKTAGMLKKDGGNGIDHFEVVICGKSVTQLNDHAGLIDDAVQAGITLTACGMSLNKFSVSEDELPQGVGVVPNGLIRIFHLQKKGYQTVTL